jgi:cell division protein FtsX
MFKMIDPMPFSIMVWAILLAMGCVIGMFGSYTTVRKHLKI